MNIERQKKLTSCLYVLIIFIVIAVIIVVLLIILPTNFSTLWPINRCTPQNHAIKESIFHHVLKPCSRFIEKQFIDRNGITQQLTKKIKISINSLGFRNISYPIKKAVDTRRIILIGDSFVYGYALDLEDTFFKKLEIRLNKSFSRKIEVWNIGVTSWGTIIQYLIVRNKVKYYSPDILILLLDNSDYFDNEIYKQYAKYDESGSLISVESEEKSFFRERKELIREISNKSNCNVNSEFANLLTTTVKYLKKIDTLAKEMGVPFVVINYPYPHQSQEYHKKCSPLLQKTIADNKILFFDLTPQISKANQQNWYFDKSNLHWNELGSTEIAKILEDFITKHFYKDLN